MKSATSANGSVAKGGLLHLLGWDWGVAHVADLCRQVVGMRRMHRLVARVAGGGGSGGGGSGGGGSG